MFKTILVPTRGTELDAATFSAADAVGRTLGAHLIFLHVGYDWMSLAARMAGLGAGLPADSDLVTRVQEQAADRAKAARTGFQDFCHRQGIAIVETPIAAPTITAEYRFESGSEAAIVAAYGRAADLIIMPRDATGAAAPLVAETALFDSGRPLLILGTEPLRRSFRTVAIAWKGTREAAHAVAAATPLIERAERVLVLEIGEDAPFDADDSARLANALKWHRTSVATRFLPPGDGGAAATLLAAAREGGADLLVMGGYGHSRFRQFLFGGVTDAVLANAALPVLMAH